MRRPWKVLGKALTIAGAVGVLAIGILFASLWLEHSSSLELQRPTGPFAVGRLLAPVISGKPRVIARIVDQSSFWPRLPRRRINKCRIRAPLTVSVNAKKGSRSRAGIIIVTWASTRRDGSLHTPSVPRCGASCAPSRRWHTSQENRTLRPFPSESGNRLPQTLSTRLAPPPIA